MEPGAGHARRVGGEILGGADGRVCGAVGGDGGGRCSSHGSGPAGQGQSWSVEGRARIVGDGRGKMSADATGPMRSWVRPLIRRLHSAQIRWGDKTPQASASSIANSLHPGQAGPHYSRPPARTPTSKALLEGSPHRILLSCAWSSAYRHARRPLKRRVGAENCSTQVRPV